MARVKAVQQPDLILISWTRNPLIPGSARRLLLLVLSAVLNLVGLPWYPVREQ